MSLSQQESASKPEQAPCSKQDSKDSPKQTPVTPSPLPVMATIENDDERLLARLGYKQELKREFTKWSTVSYAISILGVLGSVPATITVPLTEGGPATAVWCWATGSLMAMCIASSVAELVSAFPTAGGIYFVTKHVVPKERASQWGWFIGWSNFLGQAAGVASLAYSIAQMIFAAYVMNSDLVDGKAPFSPSNYHLVLIAVGILCLFGAICSLTTKALHKTIFWFAPINVLASIAICIALLVLTPNKRSPSWVFGEVTDGSGWGSKGFSFMLGFLSVAWTMTDYDATTHMSEETHDAAIRGPTAIRASILVSGLVGWMLTVTICFCLSDFEEIMVSPTGMPAAQVFLNAGGRSGGLIMWFFVILVQFFTGCSAMLANTRMAYAFARDEALPLSRIWSRINSHTSTPVNAVWLVVGFCACLNLIGLGSTQTISSIFAITAPALDISYIAVIAARRIYEHRIPFIEGPYTLGRWGPMVNGIAIVWVTVISVILFFPPVKPVTPANMNYAICVAAVIALISTFWWYASAKRTYTGPRTKEIIIQIPTDDPEFGAIFSSGANSPDSPFD